MIALAGVCFFMSFMAKQSVAALFAPLWVVLLVFLARRAVLTPSRGAGPGRARRWLEPAGWFSLGAALATGVWFGWLALFSDVENFLHYFLVLPATFGVHDRIGDSTGTLGQALTLMNDGVLARWFVLPLALAAVAAAAMLFRRVWGWWQGRGESRWVLAALLGLYLVFAQNFFILSLGDQAENGYALLGVLMAIGIVLALELLGSRGAGWRSATGAVAAVVMVALAATGIKASWSRQSHDILQGSVFPTEGLDQDKLAHLRWAEPTVVWGKYSVSGRDLRRLYRRLEQNDGKFFVFPDFTFFYGLLGARSPQPVVAFYTGLTSPYEYDAELDRRIVRELRANDVNLAVIEQRAWLRKPYEMLAEFPELRDYLTFEFEKVGSIGMFDLFERKSPDETDNESYK